MSATPSPADLPKPESQATAPAEPVPKPAQKPVWLSKDLFNGAEQCQIQHGDATYWLRRTGNGKLILVK